MNAFDKHHFDYKYKLLVVGDSGVGKSCLLDCFKEETFINEKKPTVGIDFKFKHIQVKDKNIKLVIWEPTGQERFADSPLSRRLYRDAMGIVFAYDITNANSFDNSVKWLQRIKDYADEDVEKIIIGTKCDMEDKRMVAKEKGIEIAEENGISFMETSAKTNVNVEKAFLEITRCILDKKLGIQNDNLDLSLLAPPSLGRGYNPCCGIWKKLIYLNCFY